MLGSLKLTFHLELLNMFTFIWFEIYVLVSFNTVALIQMSSHGMKSYILYCVLLSVCLAALRVVYLPGKI